MKKLFMLLFMGVFAMMSCKTETKTTEKIAEFDSFGDQITQENALSSKEMFSKFNDLQSGDTLTVKFTSKINEVCSKKGCWMKLPLEGDAETMVRFKDYGFFMPLNSAGREVIVEGKAFVTETSVEELRHYAEDAGKSAEEIAMITEPKREFAFEANGVLMKK